jgi:putative serine protease PepD
MTEWHPNGDQNDTQRLPDAGGSRHRYGDPAGGSDAPRPPYASEPSSFGGLGFHGDPQQGPPEPPRRSGRPSNGVVAGILAAALVVGGASGLAGAAGYGLVDGTSGSSTSSTSSPGTSGSSVVSRKPVAPATGSVEQVAKSVLPSVVKINVANTQEQGSGSGIIISSDGEILTNNHVASVGKGGQITVNFNDGSAKRARILGTDPTTDLAVIKAEGVSGLQPATMDTSGNVEVGENVVAIGSPFGLQATVTSGIVSALNRPVSVGPSDAAPPDGQGGQGGQGTDTTYPAIQTDAAINPGNSGGPLVDLHGDVIGINSSIRTASDSTSSGGSIGLGFAIPIDNVWPVVQQLRKGETPTHARMGVSVVSASSNNGLLTGAGVEAVNDGSAAQQAGLKKGDVITKVDDQVITGSQSLVATVRGHRPGDTVTLTVVRGGDTTKTLTVKLDSDKGSASS